MNPRACRDVCRDLPSFVGGDLGADRCSEIRLHLRDCGGCRREAGALQRSIRSLQAMAETGHPDVDDSLFAAMHSSIVACTEQEASRDPAWPRLVRWLVPMAAAVACFLLGWWFVGTPARLSVLERSPIATPVRSGAPLAVPYAGPRVHIQPLGDDSASFEAGAWSRLGPGMMGRWRLRALVTEDATLPGIAPAVEPGVSSGHGR